MKKKELAYKNLLLGVEFDKYLVEHPEIIDRIPNRSTMVFLPEYDEELYEANLKLAKKSVARGEVACCLLPFAFCLLPPLIADG